MEAMREREAQVLARRAPAPAREAERVAETSAPARRKKFRGVRYEKSGKYAVKINKPGEKKPTWLGTYTDERVAACAYDLAAKSLQGTKAKTNFDYPPLDDLIAAYTNAPGRRGSLYTVLPQPAPAAAPPAAPAPVPFEFAHGISFKAPPREPAECPAFPFLTDTTRTARARPGLGSQALAPEAEAKITLVRSIPPKRFPMPAAVAASHLVSDPVDLFGPPIHILMPVSSTETCFSSTCKTDPQLRASASSSRRMPSNSRRLMLKTPKIFAVPKTVRTPSTSHEGFTGDNFTCHDVPINHAVFCFDAT